MIRYFLLPCFCLLITVGFSQSEALKKYPEPLTRYIVQLGDQEVSLMDGEALKVEGNFEDPTLRITAAKQKNFAYGNVSFDYPIHFGYEVENEDEYRIWTLDGNNFIITVYEFDFYTEVEDYIKEIMDIFGKENCKVDKSTMLLGEKKVKGKRIEVNMIGERITFNFMVVKSSNEKTLFISFQDMLDEDLKPSDEGKATMKMMNDSILYNPRRL